MMRRDFGGEVIAAIAAVALLTFAIAFGILLSVSDNDDGEESIETSTSILMNNSETATETNIAGLVTSIAGNITATGDSSVSTNIEFLTSTHSIPIEATKFIPANVEPTPSVNSTFDIASPSEITEVTEVVLQITSSDGLTPNALMTETPYVILTEAVIAMVSKTTTASSTPTQTRTSKSTSTNTPTETNTASATATASLTATPEPTLTNTPTHTATPTDVPSETATATHTVTPSFEPTLTETSTNTPTETNTASATATASLTSTPEPTLTNTSTHTATPSATETETASATATPEPTITDTATETATPSATLTDIPTITMTDTATLTNTAVPTLTDTPTDTATHTPSPSATATDTPTLTLTLSFTPRPTETNSILPTAKPTLNVTVDPTLCGSPSDWFIYIVQPGNTLFSIARAVDSTIEELQDANCLEDVNSIFVGFELYVPRLPEGPVRTAVPSISSSEDSVSDLDTIGCTSPLVQFTLPIKGETVTGVISLEGTAFLGNFQSYRIEIRADTATNYDFYASYDNPVVEGLLAVIDTSLFDEGLYWVRLAAVNDVGEIPENATCDIPLLFE